jgi:hypothetical protein
MTPLFVYRRGEDQYLVRDLNGQADAPPPDYKLVATIEARTWLQFYLNYDAKDRRRMIRELEGK